MVPDKAGYQFDDPYPLDRGGGRKCFLFFLRVGVEKCNITIIDFDVNM
jgi:hypothetical protein